MEAISICFICNLDKLLAITEFGFYHTQCIIPSLVKIMKSLIKNKMVKFSFMFTSWSKITCYRYSSAIDKISSLQLLFCLINKLHLAQQDHFNHAHNFITTSHNTNILYSYWEFTFDACSNLCLLAHAYTSFRHFNYYRL